MTLLVDSSPLPSSTVAGFGVGSRAEIQHTITAEDIRRFVEITGDDNPLHVDHAFAQKTSLKGVVAHGMLSASFSGQAVGCVLEQIVLAILLLPRRSDSTKRLLGEVLWRIGFPAGHFEGVSHQCIDC
jgi:hypothetical protein